jgi:DNA transposition AAA+ family ATPase
MERPPIKVVSPAAKIDEELRQWLEHHIKEFPHLTTAVLSKANYIGVSKPALDGYLGRTYFLSKEAGGRGVEVGRSNIEERIRIYREKYEGTVRHGRANTFVKTRTWEELREAYLTAVAENAIVVVYGRPGIGKSRALIELAVRETQGTMPIRILCSPNITPRFFMQEIARALGLDDRANVPTLEKMCAEKLTKQAMPIIVDQGNYLSEKALGSICYLWDLARIPIVLVGTKLLHDLFFTSRLTEDVRAQLSRRVSMHYPLAELTQAQGASILKHAIPELNNEQIARVLKVTGCVHGHLEAVITRILQLQKKNEKELQSGEVSMDGIIATARGRLMIA